MALDGFEKFYDPNQSEIPRFTGGDYHENVVGQPLGEEYLGRLSSIMAAGNLARSYFGEQRIKREYVPEPTDNRLEQNLFLHIGWAPKIEDLHRLGNGFVFVYDTRPVGHEDDYIPAAAYTEYFKDGKVPLAKAGAAHAWHDQFHVDSYVKLFEHKEVATVIHTAAANASGNSQLEERFTNALDKLGDSLSVIRMVGPDFLADLVPRSYVATLVELSLQASGAGAEQNASDIFATIWKKLGLDIIDAKKRTKLLLTEAVEINSF